MSDTPTPPAPDRVAELEQKLAATERRHAIERELAHHNAIDLDAAALLAEAAIGAQAQPDIAAAVADLKRTRPFLFKAPPPPPRSASMAGIPSDAPSTLEEAATAARESGDRRILLRYLRLKRSS
jgi:hypothetical protein